MKCHDDCFFEVSGSSPDSFHTLPTRTVPNPTTGGGGDDKIAFNSTHEQVVTFGHAARKCVPCDDYTYIMNERNE